MKASELREKFLKFFESKGHRIIKSASLIPENDPTVLFTTAGMHPLVPYLLGSNHPSGKKLTSVQKCIRTGDIDEVGDDCHLTFFEMLGNWSLGDYFKKEAIELSFEFLTSTHYLNLSTRYLAFTVFKGDNDAPFDNEAFLIWKNLGISEKRIAKLEKKHNWWGPAGQTGPCGPDTEMFYWTGKDAPPDVFDPNDKLWVEIWNDVFMQYNKSLDGTYVPLRQRNVDTGMGLERVTAILQGKSSCYETELFVPLFNKLDEIRGMGTTSHTRSMHEKIIVEHLRASVFIISDGITPSNVDQGYILRRLIRRAIREGKKLGITKNFTTEIGKSIIENYSYCYPELERNEQLILKALSDEETQFSLALEKGTNEFNKIIAKIPPHIEKKIISGKTAFSLYETYGFPIELTEEIAKEKKFLVDKEGFEVAYKKHQELSRQGAEQKFKGGLADNSEQTAALHTATHLLHAALRQVLGLHVEQKGSNITAERLRFDFSHPDKVSPEDLKKIEEIVNEAINKKIEITISEESVENAKKSGAIGLFEDKYTEKVKVYTIGNFSKEICGGPHAANTADLGKFQIQKEESSSRGVRRIKAILIRD